MNLKRLAPFFVAFLLPLALIYGWWGGFNSVQIEAAVSGPYTYAYLEHTGDYSKLPEIQARCHAALQEQGLAGGQGITVLFSNPDLVKRKSRQARTGFIVPSGTEVKAPLAVDTIPARPVIRANVHAAVMLAPSKAYQALDSHLQTQGRGIQMPTVEIYEPSRSFLSMGRLTVEMAAP